MQFLTHDIPGIGGSIKRRPEDFLVEELPLYDPVGEGEHLYLFIEKQRCTTSDAAARLAKALRVRRQAVSFAGLKDKHAVTRQHFSIHLPGREADDEDLAQRVEHTGMTLLWAARHTNKLRRGHLAGNRFVIYIRDVEATSAIAAKRIIDHLVADGAPNYIGTQRFGYRGDNAALGRHLLRGEYEALLDLMLGTPREGEIESAQLAREAYHRGDYLEALEHWPRFLRSERRALDGLRQGKSPREAVFMIDRVQRTFLLSAMQSEVFNDVLSHRIKAGVFDQIVEGDLAMKHDNRAVFAVEDPEVEMPRAQRHEISPSGPMWGASMTRAAGQVDQWECEALARAGIELDDIASDTAPAGERRPMRIILRNVDVSGGLDEQGPYVRLALELDRGSFATVVLSEIMKNETADPDQPSE